MPCCRDQYKPRAIRLELVGTEVPGVAQERGDARSRWHDACALHPACSPALPAAEESRSAPGSPPAGTGTGLRARIPQRERLRCFSSGKVHGEAIRRGAALAGGHAALVAATPVLGGLGALSAPKYQGECCPMQQGGVLGGHTACSWPLPIP